MPQARRLRRVTETEHSRVLRGDIIDLDRENRDHLQLRAGVKSAQMTRA